MDPGAGAAVGAAAASMRAGFLPDSNCLLIFICRRLCSGRGGTLSIPLYWRWLRFSFSHLCLQSTALAFWLFGHISQVFRVYVLAHGFRYCHVRDTLA